MEENNENEFKIKIDFHDGAQFNFVKDNGKLDTIQNNKTYQKKNNLGKIKRRITKKSLILSILLLGIVVFLLLLTIHHVKNFFLYNSYINTANYLRENHNTLQAAENYHNAAETANKIIINREIYVKATCMEADCYLLRALVEEEDDIARQYYARAGGIYGKIINNKEYKDTEMYVDALAGLSYVYKYTEHIVDKEWWELIKLLEKEVEKFEKRILNIKDYNDMGEISLYRWIKVYSALGDFYYTLIQIDYSFMANPNISYKALIYYENYDNFLDYAKKIDKDVEIQLNDPMYHDRIKAELMILIARSQYTKNPDQYATQVIELCQLHLKDASLKQIDPESYISLKSLIANGYRILAEYYNDNEDESKKYLKKAYDELKFLFYMDSEEVRLSQIVDVGYSAIFTGFCSDEDLEKILNNYQELLSQYNVREKTEETAWYSLNICDACKAIIEYYGYSQQAWEMGYYISNEVKNIEEYVQESQKERFQEYYDYFHSNIKENMQK